MDISTYPLFDEDFILVLIPIFASFLVFSAHYFLCSRQNVSDNHRNFMLAINMYKYIYYTLIYTFFYFRFNMHNTYFFPICVKPLYQYKSDLPEIHYTLRLSESSENGLEIDEVEAHNSIPITEGNVTV